MRRLALPLLLLPCLGLTIAACGGSSETSTTATAATPTTAGTTADATAAAGGDAGGKVIIVGIPQTNSYGVVVKRGADDAAKALGADYQWVAPANFDNLLPDYTRLLNDAIAQKPAVIGFIDFAPDTFNPIIQKATAQGINFTIFDSGQSEWQKIGALTYVGEDPIATGVAAGKELLAEGAKNVMCWNHLGTLELEQRCKGVEQVLKPEGGSVDVFNTPIADSSNEAALTQAVQGYLQSHPDVQGVITGGANIAADTVTAAKNINREGLKIGSTDASTDVAKSILKGDIAFALDKQPYLQGFYTVQIGAQFSKYGMHPTAAVQTGGLILNKDNAQEFIDIQEKYGPIRGPEH